MTLDEAGPVMLEVGGKCMIHRDEGWVPPYTETPKKLIKLARGNVLMSGLGIGLDARRVNEQVSHVDIVENNPSVIDLCGQFVDTAKVTIHHADIDEWMLGRTGLYDLIYFDHAARYDATSRGGYRALTEPLLAAGGDVLFWEPLGGWED